MKLLLDVLNYSDNKPSLCAFRLIACITYRKAPPPFLKKKNLKTLQLKVQEGINMSILLYVSGFLIEY